MIKSISAFIKYPLLIILVGLSIPSRAQNVDSLNILGQKWGTFHLHFDSTGRCSFDMDTISFFRVPLKFNKEYTYITLDPSDSTYKSWSCSMEELHGHLEEWCVTSDDVFEPSKYTLIDSFITFYAEDDKKYVFKVINIGTKETNPNIVWDSEGDYRTNIVLIRQ